MKEDINMDDPEDASYVHAGLTPLVARLLERALEGKGWSGIQENMDKLLPGPKTIWHPRPTDINQSE